MPLGFIGLFTFPGEVLMDFTTRKLTPLVKLICNKSTAEERSQPCCAAALCSLCPLQSPRLAGRTAPPGLFRVSGPGRQSSRERFDSWGSQGTGGQLGACASPALREHPRAAGGARPWGGLRGPIPGVPHTPFDEGQPIPVPAALWSLLAPGAGVGGLPVPRSSAQHCCPQNHSHIQLWRWEFFPYSLNIIWSK